MVVQDWFNWWMVVRSTISSFVSPGHAEGVVSGHMTIHALPSCDMSGMAS